MLLFIIISIIFFLFLENEKTHLFLHLVLFYDYLAPWCGHCKKLAPTLDAMASYITGKFAIGKIDCTVETSICKSQQFNIRGYPTLKIYKDGTFFDYPSKRDADSMIEFMERMSLPSVNLVHSYDEFVENILNKSESGVAFVAFDSKGKEIDIKTTTSDSGSSTKQINTADVTTVEKIIASTPFLQMYGQSSRVLQSITSFAVLHPKHKSELIKFLETSSRNTFKKKDLTNQMLLRIEKNVAPLIYESDPLSSADVISWVKSQYMPLVTKLDGHNFRLVTSLKKPLLLGIVDPLISDTTEAFLDELRNLAQFGSETITKKYKFAQMDGKKFHSFLRQFNISSDSKVPQAIVVNIQNRTYYQNDTFSSIQDFIDGVETGVVEEQQSDDSNQSILKTIHSWFVKYMPYSVIVVTVTFAFFCWFIMTVFSDESESYDRLVLSERQIHQLQRTKNDVKKVKKKTLKED